MIGTANVKVHQTQDEEWRELRRLSSGWSVECECIRSGGKLSPDSCRGIVVLNPQGQQVGTFRGKRFQALESHDGVITIFEKIGGAIKPCESK